MKFSVTMKDPDGVYEAVKHAVMRSVENIEGLTEQERDLVHTERVEKTNELISKWFSCGEYLTVIVDTEAGTCTISENR